MRKFSAILLLSVFTFSQYARQMSYLECKFSNSLKADFEKCDCAKQAGFDKQDTDPSPVSKAHTHIHFDDFSSAVKEIIIASNFKTVKSNPNRLHVNDECEGSYPKPWQPPNA